jgi:hypothetical protein
LSKYIFILVRLTGDLPGPMLAPGYKAAIGLQAKFNNDGLIQHNHQEWGGPLMSDTACKLTRTSFGFSASSFVLFATLLVTLLALAKTPGAGPMSGKPSVASQHGDKVPLVTHTATGASASDAVPPVFFRRVTYDSGGQLAWSIAVADLNGDGKPDIVVTNHSGTVGVLLGKSGGFFQPVVAYDSGGLYSHSIVVVDLNKDGRLDLVVVDDYCASVNESCVSVLLGNGDGTFQPAATYDAGGYPYASGPGINIPIFVADVNGDGKPDLVVANATDRNQVGDGVVGVLFGNGNGTFQPVVRYDSGGFGVSGAALADVNGDGKLDVVVVNCGGPVSCAPPTATVGVLLGNGNGTFQTVKTYGTGGWGSFASPLAVADVNNDGKLDILVGNQCPQENGNCVGDGTVGVLLGNGNGTFQTSVTHDTGSGSTISMAVADLNGDGKLDLAVANNGTTVLLGNGDGTFQPAQTYFGGGCCQVLVADLNLDGRPDLLNVAGTGGAVSVYLGKGDGTFEAGQTFSLGGKEFSWVAVADVNKDGRPDLLAANSCSQKTCGSQSGTVSVLLNVRATTKTVLSTSGSPSHFGQPVTFTATVTSNHGPIPDGELVKFYDGAKFLASVPLTGGATAYTISTLSVATHTIKARYGGDAFFKPSTGQISQVVVP